MKQPLRAHMPGHKGTGIRNIIKNDPDMESFFKAYKYDITEIDGADSLISPCGIIEESERNAEKLFGCPTYYSTEGSSLCIRAMVYLIKKLASANGHAPMILAGRNAHSSFVNACAILDVDVEWIMQMECDSYESCTITSKELGELLENIKTKNDVLPDAVYITSPDYLGNIQDIGDLAEVCHRYGILLLVDNAHGAYLKFLEHSLHPMDLGADMCCDSAHKTLPVLTGGAYLHIANPEDSLTGRQFLADNARQALSIFATTSPSYLILQSLDLCNLYLESDNSIPKTAKKVSLLKDSLISAGYHLTGNEPLKLTISSDNCDNLNSYLKKSGIYTEYHDKNHIVMMFSGNTSDDDFKKIETVLISVSSHLSGSDRIIKGMKASDCSNDRIARKEPPVKAMTFKEAMLAESKMVDVDESVGLVLAQPVLNCPPCVPVYMCGEAIGEEIKNYCSGKVAVVK